MEQRSDEWFAARAGKFTGSRFGDLMATTKSGPSTSRANLIATLAVERLTGKCSETYSNTAMQRGTELEPEALDAYGFETGVCVESATFIIHATLAYVGVSPDGLVGDDGLVEVKCPSAPAKHLSALLRGQHATEYKWQLQGQLWVTGRAWVDAVSYHPEWPPRLRLAITRVMRDEDAISALHQAVEIAEREVLEIVERLGTRNG